MAVNPMSVIQGLPRLKWRGLEAPEYDVASFDFDAGLVDRQYPYIPGTGHDNTGRRGHALTFKLYFLNSITKDAFPDLWDQWRPFLFDGESGEMVHPLLGPIMARSRRGRVNVEARTTAGIIVDVDFAETIDDPNEPLDEYLTTVSVKAYAEAAQEAMSDADIPFPDGAPVTDFLDAVKQIEGMLVSLTMTVEGFINQVKGTVSTILTGLNPTHENAPCRSLLTQFWCQLDDLEAAASAESARAVGTATATSTTTLDDLARQHGNTVAEIMTLNSTLLGAPVVGSGTLYRYYK